MRIDALKKSHNGLCLMFLKTVMGKGKKGDRNLLLLFLVAICDSTGEPVYGSMFPNVSEVTKMVFSMLNIPFWLTDLVLP